MKIFISWSGKTGQALAEILHQWLPSVIQAVKPYFSADDIAKGARWSSEIATELEASQIGLIVVTRETCEAPWIMFEAGALSKNIGKAKVSPILFDLDPPDIKGPLVQFQSTKFEKTDIKRLMRMINSELGDSALADNVLNSAFDLWWPRLEKAVTVELGKAHDENITTLRSERELLEELLGIARSIARNDAKEGAWKKLQGQTLWEKLFKDRIKYVSLSRKEVKSRMESGGDLTGANMMDVKLRRLDLSGANLRGANLVGADLTGTKLINANLKAANLERAILTEADVQGANISYVNFWCARMNNLRNLTMVDSMDRANFYGVEGLNPDDKKYIFNNEVLDIDNYPEFLSFFNQRLGMSRTEISDLFLWTAHPDFASYLSMLFD